MMKKIVTVMLLSVTPTLAGQIGLSWDPVEHPTLTGYRIYMGDASGAYGTPINVPLSACDLTAVSPRCGTVLTVPDNCAVKYYAMKSVAMLSDGETESENYSEEVYSMARPTVASVTTSGTGTFQINGDNLDGDVQVYVNNADVPLGASDVTVVNCQQINIPDTPIWTLKIVNPGECAPGVQCPLEVVFDFPLSAPGGLGVF